MVCSFGSLHRRRCRRPRRPRRRRRPCHPRRRLAFIPRDLAQVVTVSTAKDRYFPHVAPAGYDHRD